MGTSVLEAAEVTADATRSRPLILGVCSGPEAGRVIQLVKAKCYLGSGKRRTAPQEHSRPDGMHCLILRGPTQTIVRRWSPSARLNGRAFDDAVLNVGDRLQMDGLELEVLTPCDEAAIDSWRERVHGSSRTADVATRELASREEDLARRAAGIERIELELQTQLAEQTRKAADLDARQSRIDLAWAELARRRDALAEQESAGEADRIELEQRAAELEQLRAELDRDRGRFEAAQHEAAQRSTRLDERERQQQLLTVELDARSAQLDSTRAELQRVTESLEADRALLEADRAQFEADRQALAEERRAYETVPIQATVLAPVAETSLPDESQQVVQIEQRHRELDEREEAIQKRLAELERETTALGERLERHSSDEQSLAARTSDVAARENANQLTSSQLAALQLALTTEREQLSADRAALEVDRDELRRLQVELVAAREEIDRERQDFAAACSVRDSELQALREQLETESRQLADVRDELERNRSALAERREAFAAERAAAASEVASRFSPAAESQEAAGSPEHEASHEAADAAATAPSDSADAAKPAESDDDFDRRLEALSLLRKDSPTVTHAAPRSAAASHPVDEVTDEKKAIESYMAQLLQRARGEGGSKETPVYIPVGRATGVVPSSEPAKAIAEVVEPQPKPKPPVPRPPAPVADLPAMRELANLSTQAALETHSRSVLINQIYSKSTITLAAILIGAVLMCATASLGRVALFAGMAALIAGVVFGARLPLLIADYVRAGRAASGDEVEDDGDDDDAVEPAKR